MYRAFEKFNRESNDEHSRLAEGIAAQMENFSTYFGFKLAHLLFGASEQLSKTLQSKDTALQDALDAAELAQSYYARICTEEMFDTFYKEVLSSSKDKTSQLCLPRKRKRPK